MYQAMFSKQIFVQPEFILASLYKVPGQAEHTLSNELGQKQL